VKPTVDKRKVNKRKVDKQTGDKRPGNKRKGDTRIGNKRDGDKRTSDKRRVSRLTGNRRRSGKQTGAPGLAFETWDPPSRGSSLSPVITQVQKAVRSHLNRDTSSPNPSRPPQRASDDPTTTGTSPQTLRPMNKCSGGLSDQDRSNPAASSSLRPAEVRSCQHSRRDPRAIPHQSR